MFDHSTGQPVAVMHHYGKNPYGSLDPLELSNVSNAYDRVSADRVLAHARLIVKLAGEPTFPEKGLLVVYGL